MPRRSTLGASSFSLSQIRGIVDDDEISSATRGKFFSILDSLSAGRFAAVGFFDEMDRRSKGFPDRPLLSELKRAYRERRSFTELTGNVWTGTALDFIVDPVNLIPLGFIPKVAKGIGLAAKTTSRTTGFTRQMQQLDKWTDNIRTLKIGAGKQKVKELAERSVIGAKTVFGGIHGGLKARNPRLNFEKSNDHLNFVEGEVPGMVEDIMRGAEKLVPDLERRREVFLLLHERPISGPQAKILGLTAEEIPVALRGRGVKRFQKKFAALADNEKEMFVEMGPRIDQLEALKIKTGFLEKKRAAGFIKASGQNYVPWRQGTRDDVIRQLKNIEAGIISGDSAVDTFRLSDIQEQIKVFEAMRDVNGPQFFKAIEDLYGGRLGVLPNFLRPRKLKGTSAEALASLNTDIAVLVAGETAQVRKLAASIDYIESLHSMMDGAGLVFDASLRSAGKLQAAMITKLGRKEATKRIREGMVSVEDFGKNVPENIRALFKDKLVPKSFAKEIGNVITKYSDPDHIEAVFKTYTDVQNFWKAWTLSIFPAYHARNVISNIWNNYLAGMNIADPKVMQEYRLAWQLDRAHKLGKLDDTHKVFQGMTQKGLWKAMRDKRIVRGGQFTGELGQYLQHQVSRTTFLTLDPRKNKAVQKGFKIGTFLEDHARIAHALNRMRKGDSLDTAAASVQKYLFDYKYGLSGIESKVFRNGLMPFYAWCVPEDTECLTEEGWLPHDKLRRGMKALVYRLGTFSWEPIKDWRTFDYDGLLLSEQSKTIDIQCTPDHRWYCYDQQGRFQVRRAIDLRSNFRIPIAAEFNQISDVSPDDAARIGWVYTDGYTRTRGNHTEVVVYQSPKKHLKQVVNLFGAVSEEHYSMSYHSDSGVACVRIIGGENKRLMKLCSSKEELPRFVSTLSREAAETMYQAMMDAEGTREEKFDHFSQLPGPVLDSFQILCLLTGRSANISKRGCYIRKHKVIKHMKWDTVWYKGKVWCPITDAGTWVMRRNGKVCVTGNTRFNLPLQLEMLVRAPRKFNRAGIGLRVVEDQTGGPGTDEIHLAEWMKHGVMLPWKWDKKREAYLYFGLGSWWPAADIEKVLSFEKFKNEMLNLLSPLVKIIPEMMWNHNSFTKRPISEFPGQTKNLLGIPLNAYVHHLFGQVRVAGEVDRLHKALKEGGPLAAGLRLIGLKSYPVGPAQQKRVWKFMMNDNLRHAKKNSCGLQRRRTISMT